MLLHAVCVTVWQLHGRACCDAAAVHLERHKLDFGAGELIHTAFVGETSDAEAVESLRDYQQLLAAGRGRGHKLVEVLDIRQASTPTPRQRALQAE